jgi:hypothetical protein
MIEEQITIGLVVERRDLIGEWGGVAWRPTTIFPTPPDVEPGTSLGSTASAHRFYAGAFPLSLYSTDTTNYRDNLASGAPKLWIVMRAETEAPLVQIQLITADPAEGEGATEAGNNIVETIDMPGEIAGVIAAFIAAHHVERAIIKRRRDGQAPDVRWRDGSAGGPGKRDRT